jgi:competence ComEA-like helix-hairpin-helix protein
MKNLLKKSDRIILIVGLCIGCIAFAHPQLSALFHSIFSGNELQKVNGEEVVLEDVTVKTPELIKQVPLIDLNEAGVKKLEKLPGVGPVLAERIVKYRNNEGGFTSVDELNEVSGIGPAKLKQIKEEAKAGG